jgi:hypothetical protein
VAHGGDGGIAHSDTCPANQAVIGFQGEVNDADGGLVTPVVSRIEAVCGALALDGTASNQIVVGPGVTMPEHGSYSGGQSWVQMCQPNQVVSGYVGRSGAFLDQVAFECGHWIASGSGAASSFTMDSTTTLAPAGGDGGSAFAAVPCPQGQMAIGTLLRSGFFIDSFSLICSTPPLPGDSAP